MICLEFTRDRIPCYELADILSECNQGKAADKLRRYNKSEIFMEYVENGRDLRVIKAKTLRSGVRSPEPRGVALIILNEVTLKTEADRFASIYNQLDFDVIYNVRTEFLTCNEIALLLSEVRQKISKDKREHDAFILMFIGHGVNDSIQGKESWFGDGYSYFGRALSHNIAQFAWYKDMDEIFRKTILRMEQDFMATFGACTLHRNPEMRQFACERLLFFNPGLPDND
ncbi:unnamed protein product [Oppiella nova]|uniref:Caspase family p20 domain-containing protein n=1 Tax=Oppiella nova TaxID=334625 RepID=A0A7R9M256_9ACAR|nr:unnamed protein product [Oppiella nova]CAG2169363.1 unnamed protein product [Oppiella nova]